MRPECICAIGPNAPLGLRSWGALRIPGRYDASGGLNGETTGGYDIMTSENASGFGLETKQGQGQCVAFTTRNRFAVLMPGGQIGVRNLHDQLPGGGNTGTERT